MTRPPHLSEEEARGLMYRYALWCYKTLKEEWDRTQRYWTQLEIDEIVGDHLQRALSELQGPAIDSEHQRLVDEFARYVTDKRARVHRSTYRGETSSLAPRLWFLQQRLIGLKKAVTALLGEAVWREIQEGYEHEMRRRILTSASE